MGGRAHPTMSAAAAAKVAVRFKIPYNMRYLPFTGVWRVEDYPLSLYDFRVAHSVQDKAIIASFCTARAFLKVHINIIYYYVFIKKSIAGEYS